MITFSAHSPLHKVHRLLMETTCILSLYSMAVLYFFSTARGFRARRMYTYAFFSPSYLRLVPLLPFYLCSFQSTIQYLHEIATHSSFFRFETSSRVSYNATVGRHIHQSRNDKN